MTDDALASASDFDQVLASIRTLPASMVVMALPAPLMNASLVLCSQAVALLTVTSRRAIE